MNSDEREQALKRVRYATTGLAMPALPTDQFGWESIAMDYARIVTNPYLTDREREGAALALALITAHLGSPVEAR